MLLTDLNFYLSLAQASNPGFSVGMPGCGTPAITVSTFKNLATAVIEGKLGSKRAKAYALLMFGSTGFAGLIDFADFGQAMRTFWRQPMNPVDIVNFTNTMAKRTFAAKVIAKASPHLSQAAFTADDIAKAAALIIGNLEFI